MGAAGLVVSTGGGLPPGVQEEEGQGASLAGQDVGSVTSLDSWQARVSSQEVTSHEASIGETEMTQFSHVL